MSLSVLATAVLASGSAAFAGSISGTAYCNIAANTGGNGSSYATNGVTLQNLSSAEASGSMCATFTSNTINYNAGYGNNYSTLQQFLNSTPGNTTYTGTTPSATQSALGTLLVLTGQSYLVNGNSYTLSHDDGVNLYISGNGLTNYLLVAQGGQTVANQSPFVFNGTTGAYSFELLYVSNYSAPSELVSNIAQTPEPSSLMLLGTGLAGVGGMLRRRFKRS